MSVYSKHLETEGLGGLRKIELFLFRDDESIVSSCEIYLFGATVTSWKREYREHIFISDKAIFNGTKAIRGGIPLVFPVFGQPAEIPISFNGESVLQKNVLSQHGLSYHIYLILISFLYIRVCS